MPNWCNNHMTITHADPEMMSKAIAAWGSGEFLTAFLPPPTDLEGMDLYNWKVSNWGTKWDIGRTTDLDNYAHIDKNGNMTVIFDSAWSPPVNAYESLHLMGFEIQAYWLEYGMCFAGEFSEGFYIDYDWNDLPEIVTEIFGEVELFDEEEN